MKTGAKTLKIKNAPGIRKRGKRKGETNPIREPEKRGLEAFSLENCGWRKEVRTLKVRVRNSERPD